MWIDLLPGPGDPWPRPPPDPDDVWQAALLAILFMLPVVFVAIAALYSRLRAKKSA